MSLFFNFLLELSYQFLYFFIIKIYHKYIYLMSYKNVMFKTLYSNCTPFLCLCHFSDMSSGPGLLKSFRELYSCDAHENTVNGYPCLPSEIINQSIIHYVDIVRGISSAGCKRRKNKNFQLMKF